MKVSTNLKSGNLIGDVSKQTGQVTNSIFKIYSSADHQANEVYSSVKNIKNQTAQVVQSLF